MYACICDTIWIFWEECKQDWTEYRMVVFVHAVEIFVILCLHKFFWHLVPIVNQFLNTVIKEKKSNENMLVKN